MGVASGKVILTLVPPTKLLAPRTTCFVRYSSAQLALFGRAADGQVDACHTSSTPTLSPPNELLTRWRTSERMQLACPSARKIPGTTRGLGSVTAPTRIFAESLQSGCKVVHLATTES